MKGLSQPLDVTGVTEKGNGSAGLWAFPAYVTLWKPRRWRRPCEIWESQHFCYISLSRLAPERLGGNNDKVMKTRKSLIKGSFSIFIIKWQFFTKKCKYGSESKEQSFFNGLLFLLLLANGKDIEDFQINSTEVFIYLITFIWYTQISK